MLPRRFLAHAEDVDPAELCRMVRGERPVVGVIGMRGDQDLPAREADDDGGMIPVARASAELHHVSLFQFFRRHLFCERPLALVVYEEIVEVFDARPRGGAVVQRAVVPAERGGKVHLPRARKDDLRGVVGAVPAEAGEVVILGIAAERPAARVGDGLFPVIDLFDKFHAPLYARAAENVPF